MRTFAFTGMWLVVMLRVALAADPQGEWFDADKLARIKIAECDGHMWGATVWEKELGGLDSQNPDPAKRARPTLGLPILIDMKPSPGTSDTWEGQVYNPRNGKLYTARIHPLTPTTLELKGCLFSWGPCLGQTWTRYVDPDPAHVAVPNTPAATTPAPSNAAKSKSSAAKPPKPGDAASPNAEFCAAVIQAFR